MIIEVLKTCIEIQFLILNETFQHFQLYNLYGTCRVAFQPVQLIFVLAQLTSSDAKTRTMEPVVRMVLTSALSGQVLRHPVLQRTTVS